MLKPAGVIAEMTTSYIAALVCLTSCSMHDSTRAMSLLFVHGAAGNTDIEDLLAKLSVKSLLCRQ